MQWRCICISVLELLVATVHKQQFCGARHNTQYTIKLNRKSSFQHCHMFKHNRYGEAKQSCKVWNKKQIKNKGWEMGMHEGPYSGLTFWFPVLTHSDMAPGRKRSFSSFWRPSGRWEARFLVSMTTEDSALRSDPLVSCAELLARGARDVFPVRPGVAMALSLFELWEGDAI